MTQRTPYDENYETCDRTYASLRIIHRDLDPAEVTQRLGVTPTESFRIGDPHPPKADRVWQHGGWFLTSCDVVTSRDLRHHLDWLLQRIGHHREAFALLHERDYLIDVTCFWTSTQGHGGPVLSPSQMRGFADLNIEVWIDFYSK